MNNKLLKQLLNGSGQTPDHPTLEGLGITEEKIKQTNEWARGQIRCGILATYIPELKGVDPDKTAIAIGDLHGNKIIVGDGAKISPSIQSVIKPFLYAYALEKGIPAEVISGVEATSVPFDADKILQPELHLEKAGHPLNNAGAISSAGAIDNFKEFIQFMRELTSDSKLDVLENVFESEMTSNSNNRAIAYRLVVSGRFRNLKEADSALKNYTRACSIGINVEDSLRASLVLAGAGKIPKGRSLISANNAVRIINAMNSFGMYEKTGEIALLSSGARALSCKSGVGGVVINVDPDRGAFSTFGALLDSAGNSVFGKHALIILNTLLSSTGAMRLDAKETIRILNVAYIEESKKIHQEILKLVELNEDPRVYRADPDVLARMKEELESRKATSSKIKVKR